MIVLRQSLDRGAREAEICSAINVINGLTDVAKLEGGMNPQSLPPLRDIPSEGRRREPSQQRQKRYRSHDGRVRRSAVKRFGPSCGGGVRGAANSKASRGMRAGRTLGGLGGTRS